jgi:hypothetical protein
MRVLVACEESQAVCIEFRKLGHEAYSCDIQECSGGHPEWHIVGDALDVAYNQPWDLMIGHPPCTYLTYAGTAHWNNPGRLEKRLDALNFFAKLWLAPIEKICLENPKGCASPTIAKYSQEIQPYYFGDPDVKTTWLWLKNLPKLVHVTQSNLFEEATSIGKPEPKAYNKSGKAIYFSDYFGPSEDRAKLRSKTFPGIAKAMAEQWGGRLGS